MEERNRFDLPNVMASRDMACPEFREAIAKIVRDVLRAEDATVRKQECEECHKNYAASRVIEKAYR